MNSNDVYNSIHYSRYISVFNDEKLFSERKMQIRRNRGHDSNSNENEKSLKSHACANGNLLILQYTCINIFIDCKEMCVISSQRTKIYKCTPIFLLTHVLYFSSSLKIHSSVQINLLAQCPNHTFTFIPITIILFKFLNRSAGVCILEWCVCVNVC